MALKPENPVVGGTVLRRAAIASPNYVPGVSGWTVNQDGSAEFNNLVIRGIFAGTNFEINSDGAFFYSGTPAAGNLIISLADAAGTDGLGNAYQAGVTSYEPGESEEVFSSLFNAEMLLNTLGMSSPASMLMVLAAVCQWQSGVLSGADSPAAIQLSSSAANGGARLVDLVGDQLATPETIVATPSGQITIQNNIVITGTLSVNGSTDTSTNGLANGDINGTSATAGLTNGTIAGTSGAASTGTAHTHSAGSYAVNNGQHDHGAGSYAVASGLHSHTL
jgi:hypothetical protein